MPEQLRTVLMTAPDEGTAETLARTLVDEHLAACVNLLPGIISYFRWEGRVQREEEVMLLAKTTASGVAALQERVVELHPYDVPEVLCLPVSEELDAYADWVRDEVRG